MPRNTIYLLTLVLITVANIIVFIFRDHFQYQPYSNYSSLYAPCTDKCVQKWKQYAVDYSWELKEAKQITDAVVSGHTQTIDKVLAIENFLYSRFHKQLGVPTGDFMEFSPLTQFKKLSSSDTVQLWCGNFAQMLSLFCWSQGIVNRYIGIQHPGNNHSLNECYIPETKSWVVADLTTNQLGIKTRDGKFLDLISFKDSIKQRSELDVISSAGNGQNLITRAFDPAKISMWYKLDDPIYFYHYTDNYKAYSSSRKLIRYFLPVSWYDTYSYQKTSNLGFYLKQILILLWVVSFFMVLLNRPKFKI